MLAAYKTQADSAADVRGACGCVINSSVLPEPAQSSGQRTSTRHRPVFSSSRGCVTAASALFLVLSVMANCSLCADGQLHAPSFPDAAHEGGEVSYATWMLTLAAALLVGCTGVLPLLFFPSSSSLKDGLDPKKLNLLLSFAVGGLLGDVFLHLLPETTSQMHAQAKTEHAGHSVDTKIGLLVIAGMVAFLVAEKLMVVYAEGDEDDDADAVGDHGVVAAATVDTNGNGMVMGGSSGGALVRRPIHSEMAAAATNGHATPARNEHTPRRRTSQNGNDRTHSPASNGHETPSPGNGQAGPHTQSCVAAMSESTDAAAVEKISPAGYLNLFANIVDNFTHGLAVSASFLAGHKIGMLTTFAIIIHEVPHEVGDFAILLKSGFSRWSAAKAQVSTASGALVGASVGLVMRNAGESILWVLPFTAGGFLYIALVSVMPTLLQETSRRQSALQVLAMVTGIVLMQVMDLGMH